MKKIIFLFIAIISFSSNASVIGKKIANAHLGDSRRGPVLIEINSCEGDRYAKLESLSFAMKNNGLKIYSLAFTYADRNGGRSTSPKFVKLKNNEFKQGSVITLKIPTQKCVDSILVSGSVLKNDSSRRASRVVSFDIFAKTK